MIRIHRIPINGRSCEAGRNKAVRCSGASYTGGIEGRGGGGGEREARSPPITAVVWVGGRFGGESRFRPLAAIVVVGRWMLSIDLHNIYFSF